MKFDEISGECLIIIFIIISLAITGICVIRNDYCSKKNFIAGGYEQVMVIGNDYPVWQKIK